MTPGPEPVPVDPRFRARSSGPSWQSLAVFIAGVFTVLSLGLLVGLGWLVFDTRQDLRQLNNRFEAQRYVIDELNRKYAVLEDRTKEK